MQFLKSVEGKNFFSFLCEACGAEGEVAVLQDDLGPFSCPDCRVAYMQWRNHLTGSPDLIRFAAPALRFQDVEDVH